jgi:hypothetical protein
MKKISINNVKEVLTREEMRVVTGGFSGIAICNIGFSCTEQGSGRRALCNGAASGTNCHCGNSPYADNLECHQK